MSSSYTATDEVKLKLIIKKDRIMNKKMTKQEATAFLLKNIEQLPENLAIRYLNKIESEKRDRYIIESRNPDEDLITFSLKDLQSIYLIFN